MKGTRGIDDPPEVAPAYLASLQVFSQRTSLAELTDLLGTPSSGYDIGDAVSKHNPDSGQRSEAMWSLDSTAPRQSPLELHLEELVTVAERHKDAFKLLDSSSTRIVMFCGIEDGPRVSVSKELPEAFLVRGCGLTLTPALMKRLVDMRIALIVDFF
jgi:hypothetical protein